MEFVKRFFTFDAQMYLFHWQTKKYGRHRAFELIRDSIEESVDEYVETFQGKYGRVQLNKTSIDVVDINKLDLKQFIDSYIEFLLDLSNQLDGSKDSDLLNIRDEMVASLNKLKYLLTLD